PRVLVIGIDGGSFDTIDPLVERGELPHMAALLRDSASAATSTTWPAHTAPGWASMTSASYPGRHGVYQFFDTQHPAYGETLVGTTELGRSSMWEWAADQGWSGGMINVPMSHPPRDLPGYQLTWPFSRHCATASRRRCCASWRPPGRTSSPTSPACSGATTDTSIRRSTTSRRAVVRPGT